MELESRRGRRRRLTDKIANRRRSDYIHRMLDGDPSGSRWAETSAHYWAKTSIGCCTCTKKHHGAPRRDRGMCDMGARHRIYAMRAQNRELKRLIRRGVDLDGDMVSLLSSASYTNDLW